MMKMAARRRMEDKDFGLVRTVRRAFKGEVGEIGGAVVVGTG
jgi:hypothetical protein